MIKSVFRKVATWQPDGIKKVHSGLFSSMLLVKYEQIFVIRFQK